MYIVYKTTNKINNKYYIGIHKINNKYDGYLGSGKILIKAIKKYGKENFTKEILFKSKSKQKALNKEKELVNSNTINDKLCYNLKIGGEGGWDFINKKIKEDEDFLKKRSKNISLSIQKLYDNGILTGWSHAKRDDYVPWNKGKNISDIHKQRISENNASKLSDDVINKRMEDYNNIDKKRGYVTKLAKMWNISHTQVRRFIRTYIK